jgi:hypothetical protein
LVTSGYLTSYGRVAPARDMRKAPTKGRNC